MSAREADPDVLIIGAGPTGAVAAKRFVEAGMRVVVLEQGDWPDYSKARADNPDFELTMGRYWSGNPNRRQAAADYPIDDTDSDISAVLYNAVGAEYVDRDGRTRCSHFASTPRQAPEQNLFSFCGKCR